MQQHDRARYFKAHHSDRRDFREERKAQDKKGRGWERPWFHLVTQRFTLQGGTDQPGGKEVHRCGFSVFISFYHLQCWLSQHMVADTQEISSIPGKAPSLKARAWGWKEGPRGLGLTTSLSLRSKIFLPESNSHHPSKWTSLNLISPLSKSQIHMFNCLPATIAMSQQPSHFKNQTNSPQKNPLNLLQYTCPFPVFQMPSIQPEE